ncbi:MAG: bacillithiol system redox-active protein YtxJ [Flavobacteriia bacterium]|jgi:bacillithiol system protein YtxJ
MGLFTSNNSTFPWTKLTSLEQLDEILTSDKKVLIFKHSTRCSISSMALNNFEREFTLDEQIETYFLDLLQHRDISNAIAEKANVYHQSPQVIVFENKKSIYNASHGQIDALTINKL